MSFLLIMVFKHNNQNRIFNFETMNDANMAYIILTREFPKDKVVKLYQ